jgi:hypothetical protein
MKALKVVLVLSCSLVFYSCKKNVYGCQDDKATNYNPEANAPGPSNTCKYEGSVIFWYDSPGTDATVRISDRVGTITKAFTSKPECGTAGCATFKLDVGTYKFTAESLLSEWEGSVTVTANGCSGMLLTN